MTLLRRPGKLLYVVLLGLWLIAGCGPSRPALAPLSGEVTLDGQPIEGVAIVFAPVAGGRPAQALTDSNGRFNAWTFEPGDGALLGEHQVALSLVRVVGIEATDDGLEGSSSGPIRMESSLPAHYGSVRTSGITAEVEPGRGNFVSLSLFSDKHP